LVFVASLIVAPGVRADDATMTAPYDSGREDFLCDPSSSRCAAFADADAETGTLSASLSVDTDGLPAAERSIEASGSAIVSVVHHLPAPVQQVTYTAAVHLDSVSMHATPGRLSSATARLRLVAAAGECIDYLFGLLNCEARADRLLTDGDTGDVTLSFVLRDPEGDLLPAGDVSLAVYIQGRAALAGDRFTSLPQACRSIPGTPFTVCTPGSIDARAWGSASVDAQIAVTSITATVA
jgi:hypothetical protein